MCDRATLRVVSRQKLEEAIISRLAEIRQIDLLPAMDIYYRSALSSQLENGVYGLDNLDSAYLVDDLVENEPELFA